MGKNIVEKAAEGNVIPGIRVKDVFQTAGGWVKMLGRKVIGPFPSKEIAEQAFESPKKILDKAGK